MTFKFFSTEVRSEQLNVTAHVSPIWYKLLMLGHAPGTALLGTVSMFL
jgi:hypothetical protein